MSCAWRQVQKDCAIGSISRYAEQLPASGSGAGKEYAAAANGSAESLLIGQHTSAASIDALRQRLSIPGECLVAENCNATLCEVVTSQVSRDQKIPQAGQ